jgi:hypothetical protein
MNQLIDGGKEGGGECVGGDSESEDVCYRGGRSQGTRTYCIYVEYHSVCPLVRIGTLSPASECSPPLPPPPGNQMGGDTLACG